MVVRLVAPFVLTGALALAPVDVGTTPPTTDLARVLAPAVHGPGTVHHRDADPAGPGVHLRDLPR